MPITNQPLVALSLTTLCLQHNEQFPHSAQEERARAHAVLTAINNLAAHHNKLLFKQPAHLLESLVTQVAARQTVEDIFTTLRGQLQKTEDVLSIFEAAKYGFDELIAAFIEQGVDLDKARPDGATPAFIAAQEGHDKVIAALARGGADLDKARLAGATPAFIAAAKGHDKVIAMLALGGADLSKATPDGATPAYVAARNGHDKVIAVLALGGADLNEAIPDGTTPAFIAAQEGHDKVIAALAGGGADLNKAMPDGATPAHIAAQNGHGTVILALAQHGANIDVIKKVIKETKNSRGETLLHQSLTSPETLGQLIALFLEKERLPALTIKEGRGRTTLANSVYHPEALRVIFALLPPEDHAFALSQVDGGSSAGAVILYELPQLRGFLQDLRIKLFDRTLLRGTHTLNSFLTTLITAAQEAQKPLLCAKLHMVCALQDDFLKGSRALYAYDFSHVVIADHQPIAEDLRARPVHDLVATLKEELPAPLSACLSLVNAPHEPLDSLKPLLLELITAIRGQRKAQGEQLVFPDFWSEFLMDLSSQCLTGKVESLVALLRTWHPPVSAHIEHVVTHACALEVQQHLGILSRMEVHINKAAVYARLGLLDSVSLSQKDPYAVALSASTLDALARRAALSFRRKDFLQIVTPRIDDDFAALIAQQSPVTFTNPRVLNPINALLYQLKELGMQDYLGLNHPEAEALYKALITLISTKTADEVGDEEVWDHEFTIRADFKDQLATQVKQYFVARGLVVADDVEHARQQAIKQVLVTANISPDASLLVAQLITRADGMALLFAVINDLSDEERKALKVEVFEHAPQGCDGKSLFTLMATTPFLAEHLMDTKFNCQALPGNRIEVRLEHLSEHCLPAIQVIKALYASDKGYLENKVNGLLCESGALVFCIIGLNQLDSSKELVRVITGFIALHPHVFRTSANMMALLREALIIKHAHVGELGSRLGLFHGARPGVQDEIAVIQSFLTGYFLQQLQRDEAAIHRSLSLLATMPDFYIEEACTAIMEVINQLGAPKKQLVREVLAGLPNLKAFEEALTAFSPGKISTGR